MSEVCLSPVDEMLKNSLAAIKAYVPKEIPWGHIFKLSGIDNPESEAPHLRSFPPINRKLGEVDTGAVAPREARCLFWLAQQLNENALNLAYFIGREKQAAVLAGIVSLMAWNITGLTFKAGKAGPHRTFEIRRDGRIVSLETTGL